LRLGHGETAAAVPSPTWLCAADTWACDGRAKPCPQCLLRGSHPFHSLGGDCGALWPALPSQPAVWKCPHPPFAYLRISLRNLHTSYQLSRELLSTKSHPWEELWVPGVKSVRSQGRRTASHIHSHPCHMLCDDVHQT